VVEDQSAWFRALTQNFVRNKKQSVRLLKTMKLMKTVTRILILMVTLSVATNGYSQASKAMIATIDSVIFKAKNHSINSRFVKWDSIKLQMYKAAGTATSVKDLRSSFEILSLALNDRQAVFMDASNNSRIGGYPEYQDAERQTQISPAAGAFTYSILEDDIRYMRIVPTGDDVKSQAALIRQAVDSLSKNDAGYWIVDLRYASGGDMHALFAGMGPLLGEGLVATAVAGKKIMNLYAVHNGKLYDNQKLVVDFPSAIKDMYGVKIAVLTSEYTSGAAEILALALKGRKNTKLIGEPTRGNVFGTKSFKVASVVSMTISETMYMDRKGTEYKGKVIPDTTIQFEPGQNVKHDSGITEASLWLMGSSSAKVAVK
jgi:carboxyl-terminal processing protease